MRPAETKHHMAIVGGVVVYRQKQPHTDASVRTGRVEQIIIPQLANPGSRWKHHNGTNSLTGSIVLFTQHDHEDPHADEEVQLIKAAYFIPHWASGEPYREGNIRTIMPNGYMSSSLNLTPARIGLEAGANMTVTFASTDEELARRVCQSMASMNRGIAWAQDTMTEVVWNPLNHPLRTIGAEIGVDHSRRPPVNYLGAEALVGQYLAIGGDEQARPAYTRLVRKAA